jgi:hypothetical protein
MVATEGALWGSVKTHGFLPDNVIVTGCSRGSMPTNRIVEGARPTRNRLHTNGSENDTRCQVTKRKVSAGTRSDIGRDCRDAFLSLAKTCGRLEIAFWDYLGDRLAVPDAQAIPPLLIILARARAP